MPCRALVTLQRRLRLMPSWSTSTLMLPTQSSASLRQAYRTLPVHHDQSVRESAKSKPRLGIMKEPLL